VWRVLRKRLHVYSNESTFHVSGKVNTHNCRIWGSENPRVFLEHVRDSPKVNVFCALSKERCMIPSSSWRRSLPVSCIWTCSNKFLIPQLDEDFQEGRIHFQQDGAPPHYEYLSTRFPGRWIGRAAPIAWPPRSLDLTPMDFFLWGFVKDRVFVPPLLANVVELRTRITAAVTEMTPEILSSV
jgi:hypothetical protein